MKNVFSIKCAAWVVVVLLFWARSGAAQTPAPPVAETAVALPPADTLEYPSGTLKLKGLLWRPAGPGPFPAIVLNHGSELTGINLFKTVPVLLTHGYAVFAPFRRGNTCRRGTGATLARCSTAPKK